MKNESVRKITGIAILIALEIVLAVVSLFWKIGPFVINLALIPVALCAIMYGPWAGALIGLVNGAFFLIFDSAAFFSVAPVGTVFTCLLKCTIAGMVSGLVYKLLSKKNELFAVILASLLVPLLNTGVFVLASFTIVAEAVRNLVPEGANLYRFYFLVIIGWNFIFEFAVTAALSTTIYKIITIVRKDQ